MKNLILFIIGGTEITPKQKKMFFISLIAGCLLALFAGWNYMHIATIGFGKRKIIMLAQVFLVEWFLTSFILFTIISNWYRANRVFWLHFIAWGILYSIAYFFLSPGFIYSDSYGWLISGLDSCSRRPWLLGNLRHYMPYLHYQLFLFPYYDFFMIVQYGLVTLVIALTAQITYSHAKSIVPLIIFNTLLFISIPFHIVVLALVRETPYAVFTTFAAVLLFHLLSKSKNDVYSSPLFFYIGVFAVLTTILHPQGILLAFIVASIILFNAFQWQYDRFVKNGVVPAVSILCMALVANFVLGHKSQPWYQHVVPFEGVACYIYFHPELKDSKSEETREVMEYFFDLNKYQKNRITAKGHLAPGYASICLNYKHIWDSPRSETIRFRRAMLRLIKDNPGIFIEARVRLAINQYNLGRGVNYLGFRNTATGITQPNDGYHNDNFPKDKFTYIFDKLHIPKESKYLPKIHDIVYKNPSRLVWSVVPHIIILFVILPLNYYIPKAACTTLLYFGYTGVCFLMVPFESYLYLVTPIFGALFVLPLAMSEFYERYIKLNPNKINKPVE
jgi:hypothetical protein